ncbi:MAG: glycoside hydrolase family 71/99-like protein [Planctomycetota bacterium]
MKKAFTLIELPAVVAAIAVLMGILMSTILPGRSIADNAPTRGKASFLDDVPDGIGDSNRYDSYKGLLMTGYQGWFNAPGDGADKDWTHYRKNGVFKPGHCTIDFWPDVTEYEKTYKTAFHFADGSPAYVFSSYDASTTDLHFKWMADYGIDGAFMQRFIHRITESTIKNHYHVVFESAMQAATKHNRAISIRYDLTGMAQGYSRVLLADLDEMIEKYDLFERVDCPTFLHHNGKPLIAVGGVGFSDDIAGTDDIGYLDEAEIIIAGLVERGFSIMIRVPARWREFGGNAVVKDPEDRIRLHQIIKTCDILMPWHVGAYREESYRKVWPERIRDDINWCQSNNMDYVPVIFPGFSRLNLKGYDDGSFRPRNGGSFFWLQASSAIQVSAKMLFLAQFDEMDEGTQYFKCLPEVPVGPSPFIPYEKDIQSDHYLWLAGKAGEMLRAEIPFSTRMPERVSPAKRSR